MRFHVFTTFRGDRGAYVLRIVLENPEGDAVKSIEYPVTFENDMGWRYLGAYFTVNLTRGVWTAKVYVDQKFQQLATFKVIPAAASPS